MDSWNLMVFADMGIAYAFENSDAVGQGICWILIVWSAIVWIVMFMRGRIIVRARKSSASFIEQFRKRRNPLGLREKAMIFDSPASRIYLAACDTAESFDIPVNDAGRRTLSDEEIGVMQSVMEQQVNMQILHLEKWFNFLVTSVSGSPFLGLFGTVWGITVAFTSLAQLGKADIQSLAPGVSGALLTTVIALIVAIPSLFGYNLLNTRLRELTVELDGFVTEFISRMKTERILDQSVDGERGNSSRNNAGRASDGRFADDENFDEDEDRDDADADDDQEYGESGERSHEPERKRKSEQFFPGKPRKLSRNIFHN